MNLNNQNEQFKNKKKKINIVFKSKKFVFFECNPQRNYEKETKGADELCVKS